MTDKSLLHNNVPELRFPGFDGEWKGKKVSDITTRVSDPVKVESEKLYQQIGIRSHGKGLFYKERVTGESLGNKRVFWIKEGAFIVNIVFAWEQAVAKTTEQEKGMIASHRFPMYSPIKDISDTDFLLLLFLTKRGKYYLEMASPGGAGRNKTLGQKEFDNVSLIIPSIKEQKKIAEFLGAIDEKIGLLERKKEKLEEYKKGLLQQIFPSLEGNPAILKFGVGSWKWKQLGNIIDFYQTNSLSRSQLNYESGSVKNIHYGDIHTKYASSFKIENEQVPFVNEEVELSKIKDESYCREGDLIIADASEDYKDIGKAIEVISLNGEKLVAGLHTYIARDKEPIAKGFKANYMQSDLVRRQIMKMATGISVLGISKGNLAKIKISLPPYEEQKKIAEFLGAVDEKIELVGKQIDKAKEFKKGLLQKMFV